MFSRCDQEVKYQRTLFLELMTKDKKNACVQGEKVTQGWLMKEIIVSKGFVETCYSITE